MPSTRDIRRRIKSVKNTAQITKAMQMVAASKMRRAQQAALAGRPYATLMNSVLAQVTANAGDFSHPLMEIKPLGDGQDAGKTLPAGTSEYLFEPDAGEVLGALLPHYLNYQVYQILLEAKASEHSARMVAMKNATDNAKELIKDLTLEYNKLRQSNITRELLEITSAAMAMS